MQEKSPGYASRNSFLEFVWCVAAEQHNNNKNSDSSQFYQYILIVRIESLRSYAESRAGKKQIFNENARNLISVVQFLITRDISLQCCVQNDSVAHLIDSFTTNWKQTNLSVNSSRTAKFVLKTKR